MIKLLKGEVSEQIRFTKKRVILTGTSNKIGRELSPLCDKCECDVLINCVVMLPRFAERERFTPELI